ncbi:hypothetical protein Tco_0969270 [Tanacetum coccineum]
MKDKIKYRGKNIVGAFMNVPIFIGNFCVVTDFVVVKNMDAYHDKDMGDVIAGKPFCRASCVEARWFDGLITIHDGNDNVTYQMARWHPRFKHLTNAQCNKIRPLLKFSILRRKAASLLVRIRIQQNGGFALVIAEASDVSYK